MAEKPCPSRHITPHAVGRAEILDLRPRVRANVAAMPLPRLEACVAVCRELLADEPELLADLTSIFTGERPRWDRLPDDLRRGLADIAWDALVARGLAPAPGDRTFIDRRVRRCEAPGCVERPEWSSCPTCDGTGEEFVEQRGDRPTSLCAVLVLAGDLDGTLAAEALAREAAARLWPWRGRRRGMPRPTDPPHHIAWRIDEGGGPLALLRGTRALCPLLYELLARLANERRRAYWLDFQYARGARWPPQPAVERAAAALYDELVAAGERVPRYGMHAGMPRRPNGDRFGPCDRPFAELPNPFTPLCALADLGVAIERLEATTIVLARAA
jgi:hypothetical protein